MAVNYREQYERRPEVRFAQDMRLHREVILSRQTDLMPQALAGDAAAQKEMAGLSELARSFSSTMHDVFRPVMRQQIADRQRRGAEHARRASAVPRPAEWTWALNDEWVFTRVHAS